MTSRTVAQRNTTTRDAGKRFRHWLDAVRRSEIAWIVQEFLRHFPELQRHRYIVHDEQNRAIGRWQTAWQVIGTLRKLAALDSTAKRRLPGTVHVAFLGLFDESRRALRSGRDTLRNSAPGRALLDCTPEVRAELLVHAYARFRAFANCLSYSSFDWRAEYAASKVVITLAQEHLPFTQAQLLTLLDLMTDERNRRGRRAEAPDGAILRALERKALVEDLCPEVEERIATIIAREKDIADKNPYYETNKDRRAFRERFEALLGEAEKPLSLPPSPWSALVHSDLAREPVARQARLNALLQHAAHGKGARPSPTWLRAVKPLLHGEDNARIARILCGWVAELHPERLVAHATPVRCEQAGQAGEAASWRTAALHDELARRLLWTAALLDSDTIAPEIEKIAATASRLCPRYGNPFAVVFSGAVTALSMLGPQGTPALVNLRRRVKGSEVAKVDKAISEIAERQGVPAATLEEGTVPAHGFSKSEDVELAAATGKARVLLGQGTAVKLIWIGASGKPRKSPPKASNDTEKQQIAAAKACVKNVSDTLAAQAARLERLYLIDHHWSFDTWRGTYLDHPVLAHLARQLIWSFEGAGGSLSAMPRDDRLLGYDGQTLTISSDANVRLWHPIHSTTEVIQAWRRRIKELEITQPLKQAWREIYILTDAELLTETYSNRFAAHILRQSQFRALGKARGWKVPAKGRWDDPLAIPPSRHIPARGLTAELVVGVPVGADGDATDFVLPPIVTDRVRFRNDFGDFVPLDEVPPLVLSEIFRDIDLFTGVASIGNDPAWADEGDGPFADYWARAAFGDLSGSARMRRELLAELLPMLSIADKCSLDDRHLIVSGELRTYRIHLGSGHIMMASNSQYLCIIPDRRGRSERVPLPFEGDQLLSVIISKAFLLVEDDKIADQSIVRQIKGRG